MVGSSEAKILQMQAATQSMLQASLFSSDGRDIISQYRNELYAVDTTARPHNVRVVIESPSIRRQKYYQEQLDAKQHIEAETESMKSLRASLKQSAVTAEKTSSNKADAGTPSVVSKTRRATLA